MLAHVTGVRLELLIRAKRREDKWKNGRKIERNNKEDEWKIKRNNKEDEWKKKRKIKRNREEDEWKKGIHIKWKRERIYERKVER